MNILLSAYNCDPSRGSEPGLGWNWAYGLTRAGHRVWVVTIPWGKAGIEKFRELLAKHRFIADAQTPLRYV